jgi:SAM-dependent methyltransferase
MKVDYDRISGKYDDHRGGGGPYLGKLAALTAECPDGPVLEIGAGTGNNTQAFQSVRLSTLVALELSTGMIARARLKGVPAHWVQGSAVRLPFVDGSFSFVFGVYVLHHLGDLVPVFSECARVLRAGSAAFVTASTDFIERHPMNRYFPSFAVIDKVRFQSLDQVREAFLRAGFRRIGRQTFVDAPRPIGKEYVERVANKFISTYDLIPAREFEAGLERLRADVAQTGYLEVPIVWESVVVRGSI